MASLVIKSIFVERSTMVSMGVVVSIQNQIHLKIPKMFSVRLLGTRMNARSIGYGETLVFGSAPIFELVAGVARQFPACIGMDQVVDALV